jgi:ribosomal protein L37AE/L43A
MSGCDVVHAVPCARVAVAAWLLALELDAVFITRPMASVFSLILGTASRTRTGSPSSRGVFAGAAQMNAPGRQSTRLPETACPKCGETRLFGRVQGERWFCDVCAQTWTVPTDQSAKGQP